MFLFNGIDPSENTHTFAYSEGIVPIGGKNTSRLRIERVHAHGCQASLLSKRTFCWACSSFMSASRSIVFLF